MSSKLVKKAVFPVAGLGTRFLPATKASPKEMLPIVDKPLIQYAVEEAVEAGIEQMIFVTNDRKRAIEDHFDKNWELEAELKAKGKFQLLDMVRYIVPEGIACIYIRQPEALGLGHAVLCALPAINDEPFAVILADDLIHGGERGCLSQMVDLYAKQKASILALEDVPREETGKYGVIEPEDQPMYEGVYKVKSIVEKPAPNEAPSNHAVVGRYVFSPEIFGYLKETERGAGGEIQLTDAIAAMLATDPVLGFRFDGKRYDCGSKMGYLQATTELALHHPNLRDCYRDYLKTVCATL